MASSTQGSTRPTNTSQNLEGHSDGQHVADWNALPEELEDLILSKLPLLTLARVSRTCGKFQAIFNERRAAEQKARCEYASHIFGGQRIIDITVLVDRWLKGDDLDDFPVDPRPGARCWLHTDGTCTDWHLRRWPTLGLCKKQRVVCNSTYPTGIRSMVLDIAVGPWFPGSRMHLKISRHGAIIIVHILSDQDTEGVTLVQALLREGLAQIIHDAGQEAHIHIRGWNMPTKLTPAGFKAIIAPLMPFITPQTLTVSGLVGELKLPGSTCNSATGTSSKLDDFVLSFHSL